MTERPKFEDLVRSWVSKAEHDLLNIENNLAAKEIPWDTVGFHAQQCGEKYLKALLVFHRIDFPKIHDLTELYALLPKELPLPIDPRLLDRLNPYVIEGDILAYGSQSNEMKRCKLLKLREPFATQFALFLHPPV